MKNKRILLTAGKYFLIFLGSVIYAVGFSYITYPNDVPTGGVNGVSMIINAFTGLPVGTMSIILNIPLFIIAWIKFGRGFVIASLAGTVLSSLSVDALNLFPYVLTTEPLFICVYGGILMGVGLGIVYRVGATTGGTEIVVKLLKLKYAHMNTGTIMFIVDLIIICAYSVIFDKINSALYALITVFLMSKALDIVLYGFSQSKLCYIITDHSEELKSAILIRLDRGVTILTGHGGYSGEQKHILMCVIKPRQIVELRSIAKEFDPNAFMIINDAKEVFGEGFSDNAEFK